MMKFPAFVISLFALAKVDLGDSTPAAEPDPVGQSIAYLDLANGTNVEFFEIGEEGLIVYSATIERRNEHGRHMLEERAFSSPVEMYEELSGEPAPDALKHADKRRKQFEMHPSNHVHDSSVPPGNKLRGDTGQERKLAGSCLWTDWWQTNHCRILVAENVHCACYSSCLTSDHDSGWWRSQNLVSKVGVVKGAVSVQNFYWRSGQWRLINRKYIQQGSVATTGSWGNRRTFYFKSMTRRSAIPSSWPPEYSYVWFVSGLSNTGKRTSGRMANCPRIF